MGSGRQFNWEFETIAKHTLDFIIIVDENQMVHYVTPSFETILGYSIEEFSNGNVFEPVHPDDREYLMKEHQKAILTKKPQTNEYRVFHRNGEIKYLESRIMPVPDHPDNLAVVTIRDITDRKQMENELQKRKNRYETLQNSLKSFSQDLSSVMKVKDLENRLIQELNTIVPNADPMILTVNQASGKVEGGNFSSVAGLLPQLVTGQLKKVAGELFIKLGEREEKVYVLVLNTLSVEETMDLIWLETLVHYTVMVFENLNIIEQLLSQLEATLQSSEKPQWMIRLLFNLQEKQRMGLSSDLHDTVLQDQIALYRKLAALINQFDMEDEIKTQLRVIEQGLLDIIHQIRVTCNELRPPLLRELGLERSLENLFEHTQVSSTFKIVFTAENTADLSLNEEQTISIYRIVQELLHNADKHSNASLLTFHIGRQDGQLQIEYFDDGVGFELDKLNPSFSSMGLPSIQQRMQSLGGTIVFYTQPNKGLKVSMQLPITPIAEHN